MFVPFVPGRSAATGRHSHSRSVCALLHGRVLSPGRDRTRTRRYRAPSGGFSVGGETPLRPPPAVSPALFRRELVAPVSTLQIFGSWLVLQLGWDWTTKLKYPERPPRGGAIRVPGRMGNPGCEPRKAGCQGIFSSPLALLPE